MYAKKFTGGYMAGAEASNFFVGRVSVPAVLSRWGTGGYAFCKPPYQKKGWKAGLGGRGSNPIGFK